MIKKPNELLSMNYVQENTGNEMKEEFNLDKFINGLEELRLNLSREQIGQFLDYYELLVEWNSAMNLTAITEFDEVVEKHFLDSLCLVKVMPDLSGEKVLDLGTGAGFPGIPLKIVFPDMDLVLMDSVNKKLNFLNEVIEKLKLTRTVTVHGRAEEMARRPEYRQQFDLCVSRAVSNLSSLSEYCLPFVKTGGCFISYKSSDVETEADEARKAIYLLGGKTEEIVKFVLPGSDHRRSLVWIQKVRNTPKVYPRKAGTPVRDPLR